MTRPAPSTRSVLKGHHTGGSVSRTVAAVAGSQSRFGCCVQRQLQNPELYPPVVINQALILDDVDGAEDVAMALLRRRYTESVAQRRLAEPELPEPEHEPEATAAAVDPLVARGLGVGEEPGPDDW